MLISRLKSDLSKSAESASGISIGCFDAAAGAAVSVPMVARVGCQEIAVNANGLAGLINAILGNVALLMYL